MEIAVLGIDLGKTACSVAGLDEGGAVVLRKRIQRHRLLAFLSGLSPCIVAMEACGGDSADIAARDVFETSERWQ